MNISAQIQHRVEGHWTLQKFKRSADGSEYGRETVAEFKNLILNSGLNAIAAKEQYLTWCRVGTGSAAPVVTQSSLGSQVAATSYKWDVDASNFGSSPYYTILKNTFRFMEGEAEGNLTEIGVGWTSEGSTLFSRALILDGSSSPTVLPIQEDEFLDAVYELRVYPPLGDVTGEIAISGSGTHAYTLRAARVNLTNGYYWTTALQGPYGGGRYMPDGRPGYAYSGVIGTNLEFPGGEVSRAESYYNEPYTPGTYYIDFAVVWELDYGNFETGIKSVMFATGFGAHQIEFDPPIMKSDIQRLTLNFRHTWARRP